MPGMDLAPYYPIPASERAAVRSMTEGREKRGSNRGKVRKYRRVTAGPLLYMVSCGEELLSEARTISQRAMVRLEPVLTPPDDPGTGAVSPAAPT
jgi:hypothetical protein